MDKVTIKRARRRGPLPGGKMWITLKLWKSPPKPAPPRRIIHRRKREAGRWKLWILLIKGSGEEVRPDSVDVSGAHGYHQIALSAICQKVFFDF